MQNDMSQKFDSALILSGSKLPKLTYPVFLQSSIHIKVAMELGTDYELPFLDILVKRNTSKLCFSVWH